MFRPTKLIDPKTPINKMSEEVNQNIQVFVRCRPLNTSEKRSHIDLIPEKRTIKASQQNKTYTFDNVFDAKAKQFDVYRVVVEPLVEQVIEGYNCTVFAYGQTGTGKTYTMIGNRSDKDVSWEEDPTSGIIPRAIDQLLDDLQNQNTEYTVRVSYLELYNEEAYDLLSPLCDNTKLRIYNDTERKGSVIISGLVEIIVKTKAEIFEILEKGSLKRQTAPTLMNACSSRSHSIFSITVHIKEVTLDGEEVVKMGKLNLVDLAGSENIGRSGAVEERAREASNINKSLLTLGRVITSLVEKSSHIPYRDSKLTRLLQDSLGGKTKTSIIATISPGVEDFEDTISTLDYAQRAKKITNKPEVNLKLSKKTLISEYLVEIEKLRRDLEAARDKKGVYVDAKNFSEMESTLKAQEQSLEIKEARIDFLKEELKKLTALWSETKENLEEKCVELDTTKKVLDDVSNELSLTTTSLKQTQTQVEESNILIDAHHKAEQKLFDDAKTLLSVTDKCVIDNDFLHKKIDSYSNIENCNSEMLKNFKDQYSTQIEKVSNLNSVIYSTINNGYFSIENLIRQNMSEILSKEEEANENLSEFQSNFDCFSNQLTRLIEDDGVFNDKSESLRQILSLFKSELSNLFETNLNLFRNNQTKTRTTIDELISMCLNNKRTLEDFFVTQVSRIDETSKHVIGTINSIKGDFMLDYQNKCLENERLVAEIQQLKQVIANDSLNRRFDELNNLISQIRCEKDQRNAEIISSVDRLESQIMSNSVKELEFKNHINYKSDEFANYYKKEKQTYTQVLSDFDQQNNQISEKFVKKCETIKKMSQDTENEQNDFSSNLINHIENVLVGVDEDVSKTQQTVLLSIEDKSKCLDLFKSQVNQFTQLVSDSNKSFCGKFTESGNQVLYEYKNIDAYCDALKISQDIQLKELFNLSEDVYSNGFQLYKATGCTPQKCMYAYPKNLKITSPHERILSRYRSTIQDQMEKLEENGDNVSDINSSSSVDPESFSDHENFNADNENIMKNQNVQCLKIHKRKLLKEKN